MMKKLNGAFKNSVLKENVFNHFGKMFEVNEIGRSIYGLTSFCFESSFFTAI